MDIGVYHFRFFDIPKEVLPEIRSSSEIYGKLEVSVLKGLPISGVCISIKYLVEKLSLLLKFKKSVGHILGEFVTNSYNRRFSYCH